MYIKPELRGTRCRISMIIAVFPYITHENTAIFNNEKIAVSMATIMVKQSTVSLTTTMVQHSSHSDKNDDITHHSHDNRDGAVALETVTHQSP